jgi:hypothetical protein
MLQYHRVKHSCFMSILLLTGIFTTSLALQGNCISPPEGLIGWWKAEGDAVDQVGSNHGTLLGDATYGPGRVGQAFLFDGKNDAVSVGDAPEFKIQDFTIEAWIQRASTTVISQDPYQAGIIFSYGPGGYGFALWDDGSLFLTKNQVDAVFATLAVTDTEFHHVAVTKAGNTVRFYLDGVGQLAEPYDPEFTFTGPAAIGGRGGDFLASFLGSIDEVSIYNRALSAAEIQAAYAAGSAGKCTFPPPPCTRPPSGLVSWWPGNGNADDIVGGNHAIFSDAEYVLGQVRQAFHFDGSGKHVRIPASPSLDVGLGAGLTVEGWINPAGLVAQAPVVEWAVNGAYAAHFFINVSGPGQLYANIFAADGGDRQIETSAGVLNQDTYQHVALTYNKASGIAMLVRNGVVVQEVNLGSFTPRTSGDLYIGYRPASTPFGPIAFNGQIDEVSIYDRALAVEELAAIYEAGAFGKCPPFSERRPLARWAFDEIEGTIASDSAGTRHGTLSTAGAGFTSDGVRGNALRLNRAQGGYVNMGEDLFVSGAFTLVAWVKTEPNDATETMVVAGKHAAGTVNGYYLALNRSGFIGEPGKALFVASDPAGEELISLSDINDGEWHQVVAVYAHGLEKRLYIDGQPAEVSGPTTQIVPNSAPFLVGGVKVAGTAQGFFNGWIDELQIYDRALTDPEIHYLFVHPDAMEIPEILEPRIVSSLISQTAERGGAVEFSIEVTGQEPLIYEWRKDETLIQEATGPSLLLSELQPMDGGIYSVIVSNPWGSSDSSATLRVLWPPLITLPPVGQAVALGNSITLSVTADGLSPLSYQWFRNSAALPGATSRFLLLNNVTETSAGAYGVRVQNLDGVLMSDPATVLVYSGGMSATVVEAGLRLHVGGLKAGRNYALEYSDTIPAYSAGWQQLVTILNAADSFQFTDPEPPAGGTRYYRLRLLP